MEVREGNGRAGIKGRGKAGSCELPRCLEAGEGWESVRGDEEHVHHSVAVGGGGGRRRREWTR